MCSLIEGRLNKIEELKAGYQWQIDRNSQLIKDNKCPYFYPPHIRDWEEFENCHKQNRKLSQDNQTLGNEIWLLQKEKTTFSLFRKILGCHDKSE